MRVCCFPASAIRSVGDRIGISPPLGQHDMSQMLQACNDIMPAELASSHAWWVQIESVRRKLEVSKGEKLPMSRVDLRLPGKGMVG